MVVPDRLENAPRPLRDARNFSAPTEERDGAGDRAARTRIYAAIVCVLFLVHVARVLPALRPMLRDIGDWDESWYIYWGYRLNLHHHPGLSANPMVGAIYAIIYPLAKSADVWLVAACRYGRLFFCVSIWLVLYAIVRESVAAPSARMPPGRVPRRNQSTGPPTGGVNSLPAWSWAVPLLLFTASAAPAHLLATPNYQWGNPSDATFAVLSGLAFWQLLRFYNRGNASALAFSSGLLGLSVLARVDGLILSAIALSAVLSLNLQGGGLRSLLVPALLPFAAVVGTFLACYGLVAGTLEQGIASRSYQAFEEGQTALNMSIADWHDYQLHSRPLAFDGDLSEVRALFGTSEQNSGSPVRALLNHPRAAIDRLARTLATIPGQVIAAYGEIVAIPLLSLALPGIASLLRQRRFKVLAACCSWIVPLGSYLLFFYRPGYFLLPFFVVFALAAVGLRALVERAPTPRDVYWELALGGAVITCALLGRPGLAVGAALALAIFVAARLVRDGRVQADRAFARTALAAVAVATVVTFAAEHAEGRPRSSGAEERAVHFMRARFPARSSVGSFGPGPVWAANPTFDPVTLEAPDGSRVASREALLQWLAEHRIVGVYVNRALEYGFPRSSAVLSAAIGDVFDVGYQEAKGEVRVLVTRPEFASQNPPDSPTR